MHAVTRAVKFEFKPAEIAYREPTPMRRGTLTDRVGLKETDLPIHVQKNVCDEALIQQILELVHIQLDMGD